MFEQHFGPCVRGVTGDWSVRLRRVHQLESFQEQASTFQCFLFPGPTLLGTPPLSPRLNEGLGIGRDDRHDDHDCALKLVLSALAGLWTWIGVTTGSGFH
jgi:hypothetical protein